MQTHEVSTNMRNAFIGAAIMRSTGAAVVNQCAKALHNGAGIHKVRGWNASLSFTTAQKLGAPAFENPKMRYRFDNMVQADKNTDD